MPQTHALIEALKRLLKARSVTYAELAQRICISEASVKRMFSQKQFTLQRLDQILVAIGSDFQQLAQAVHAAQATPTLITGLTYAQEKEIIDDPRLFVVAVSALNLLPLEQIIAIYDISEAQAVKYLLRLDKIGFLELLPNNRVKLLVARTFAWIPNGPIHTYFKKEAYGDYLNSQFDGETELLRLVNVMLSKKSTAALLERLKQVAVEFSQQHQEDARLPGDERLAISFMLAARPWMPRTFKALLRQ
ncbi:helix-turn-helix domain-containing protein [Janthinobacterium sp. 64]|uniref:helix-turn-helix domain-containing protein n=1 Tax=Janthinobacterium sp. 64 TaxID=2035208 RepID=UPI000CC4DE87|nr:helix-turn-helix domain-containing protein [Janthinobacterium sp. 64]PKB21498.1 Cro/C1-type helix-turn-helix DNA-binding protein [Janthinobacterium sp. 64]